MDVRGQLAVVSGASSGIGAATAVQLARAGTTVLLLARRADALEKVAHSIQAEGGRAAVYPVDLADADAVRRTAVQVRAEHGDPLILVNNAGAGHWHFPEETTPAEVVSQMALPYFAAFYLTREFLPEMLRQRRGHIVNVTSTACYIVWPGATGYTAARWAMRGFHEALRADLHGTGICSTLLAAGPVATPYFTNNPGCDERMPGISRIFGVLAPEQVAAAIVRAIRRNRRELILPRSLAWTVALARVCPGMVQGLSVRTGWTRQTTGKK